MLSNFEKLCALSPEDFWKRVTELQMTSLSNHIDFPAWLRSDKEDPLDFLKSIGECLVKPTETELIAMGIADNETEKDMYIATHSKRMKLLEKHIRFNNSDYSVVADLERGLIVKVPSGLITFLDDEGNERKEK
jgi:hypothetical protein